MKVYIRFLTLFFLPMGILLGCGKADVEETAEQVPTEQIAIEGTEVEDYSALSYSGLEVLAYEGDSQAQIMLGRKLEYGDEETAQNFTEALSWYQMASDSGDFDGTCALGYFYLTGTGVEQNLDKAEELFNTAIDGGVDNAKVGLARVILTRGDYLVNLDAQDDEELSTEDGEKEESKDKTSTEEQSEDLKKAVELLTEAAKAEDLDGQYYLGFIYEHGVGVALDYSKAFDYYSRVTRSESMALQDQDSINHSNIALGLMYIKGHGVEVDEDTALEHFETASENGSAKASYYIGQMYESGVGVDRDYEKAMEYYLLAADKDYAPALNQIGYLYYNGYGVDVDFASAVYYQKLAALQGYAIAQVNLGFLYENGYGVERNLETALSYYEMAADSGYEGATEAVVRVKAQINEEL